MITFEEMKAFLSIPLDMEEDVKRLEQKIALYRSQFLYLQTSWKSNNFSVSGDRSSPQEKAVERLSALEDKYYRLAVRQLDCIDKNWNLLQSIQDQRLLGILEARYEFLRRYEEIADNYGCGERQVHRLINEGVNMLCDIVNNSPELERIIRE